MAPAQGAIRAMPTPRQIDRLPRRRLKVGASAPAGRRVGQGEQEVQAPRAGGDSAGRVLHGGPPGASDDAAEAFLKAAWRLALTPRPGRAGLPPGGRDGGRRPLVAGPGRCPGDAGAGWPASWARAPGRPRAGRSHPGASGGHRGAPPLGRRRGRGRRRHRGRRRRGAGRRRGALAVRLYRLPGRAGRRGGHRHLPGRVLHRRLYGAPRGARAIWFPTETASALAEGLGEPLREQRGEAAGPGVPLFGAGDPPARGQVQARSSSSPRTCTWMWRRARPTAGRCA